MDKGTLDGGHALISQPQAAKPPPRSITTSCFVYCDIFLPLPPHSPIYDGQDKPEKQPRPRAKTVHFKACLLFLFAAQEVLRVMAGTGLAANLSLVC